MVRYKTQNDNIERFEVEKSTKLSITIDGRVQMKRNNFYNWHDTFDGAKQFLTRRAQDSLDYYEKGVKETKEILKFIEGLKEELKDEK